MNIIEHNKRLIDECKEFLDNDECIEKVHSIIKEISCDPRNLDSLREVCDELSKLHEQIMYKNSMLYKKYMLFNGEFVMSDYHVNQQVFSFLNHRFIRPEDNNVVREVNGIIADVIALANIKEIWQHILIYIQNIFMTRASIVDLEVILEYINCLREHTNQSNSDDGNADNE